MSGDPDDLSQFVAHAAYRRRRTSSGETAGMPTQVVRERIHCSQCRKLLRYKEVYTVWEFAPDKAWRMRICQWCDTMVQEKEFNLKGEECSTAKDAMRWSPSSGR